VKGDKNKTESDKKRKKEKRENAATALKVDHNSTLSI
jgi:hypothetical protein